MKKYSYTIPGPPIPLKRPRISGRGCYDPQSTLKKQLQLVLKSQDAVCLSGPLSVEMIFYMPIPASWSKKKQAAAFGMPHTKKPDIDNLFKLWDFANGILWDDDSLIYNLNCFKLYSDNPRTEVKINS